MSETQVHETVFIEKQLVVLEDLQLGTGSVEQKRPSGQLKLTKINVTGLGGALVVQTVAQMKAIDVTTIQTKAVLVVETGQLYSWDGLKWVSASSVSYSVKTVEDLKTAPIEVGVAVVTEPNKGGVFVYQDDKKDVDNGGTIIKGWVRQYDGEVNVKWYGATGDGITDDTAAIQAAINGDTDIFFPKGNYRITSTLTLNQRSHLRGTTGSVLFTEERITMIAMATYSILEALELRGTKDIADQIGVLVDGGSSLSDVVKTKVIDCNFREFGAMAYKITNNQSVGHIITSCSFSNNVKGVVIDTRGYGLALSGSQFDSCNTAVQISGRGFVITNLVISNSTTGFAFLVGDTGNSFGSITNCTVSGATNSLVCDSCGLTEVLISGCAFSDSIVISATSGFYFEACNLANTSIQFNSADNNYFNRCIITGTNIVNDSSGSSTVNFWTNCYKDVSELTASENQGGYVEVKRSSDFSIPSSGSTPIVFDNTVSTSMCQHPNFKKYKFYDESTGVFDLTTVVTPGKDKVHASVQLCLGSNSSSGISVYLYRLDSKEENAANDVALDRIEAVLTPAGTAFGSSFTPYVFSGYVTRGLYKVVARNNGTGSQVFKADGTVFSGQGKVAFKARFSGI